VRKGLGGFVHKPPKQQSELVKRDECIQRRDTRIEILLELLRPTTYRQFAAGSKKHRFQTTPFEEAEVEAKIGALQDELPNEDEHWTFLIKLGCSEVPKCAPCKKALAPIRRWLFLIINSFMAVDYMIKNVSNFFKGVTDFLGSIDEPDYDEWEAVIERESLSCKQCGGVAPPVFGAENKYKCLYCSKRFSNSKHNIASKLLHKQDIQDGRIRREKEKQSHYDKVLSRIKEKNIDNVQG